MWENNCIGKFWRSGSMALAEYLEFELINQSINQEILWNNT